MTTSDAPQPAPPAAGPGPGPGPGARRAPPVARGPRTSVLAIAALILAVFFLPIGTGAFFAAGCTRGCESGGAVYVRHGEEMPREVAPTVTRMATLVAAGPEAFAFLLAFLARRRVRRSGGRIVGADVAMVAMVVSIFALLSFVPAFTCGGRLVGG